MINAEVIETPYVMKMVVSQIQHLRLRSFNLGKGQRKKGKGKDGVPGGEWGLMGKWERGVLTRHSTTVLIFI
jgi:hypothetical protein